MLPAVPQPTMVLRPIQEWQDNNSLQNSLWFYIYIHKNIYLVHHEDVVTVKLDITVSVMHVIDAMLSHADVCLHQVW